MNLQNRLNDLKNVNRIEQIPIDKTAIGNLLKKAENSFVFSKSALDAYKNNYKFDNSIYSGFYDSLRIGFDGLLRLYGYKTKSAGGHHDLVISIGIDILKAEVEKAEDIEESDNAEKAYMRIRKILQKRNSLQYDPVDEVVSRSDLNLLSNDVDFLLKKIKLVLK